MIIHTKPTGPVAGVSPDGVLFWTKVGIGVGDDCFITIVGLGVSSSSLILVSFTVILLGISPSKRVLNDVAIRVLDNMTIIKKIIVRKRSINLLELIRLV